MKTLALTLILVFFGSALSLASDYPTKQIHQYKQVQKQTIALPTHFAQPFIIDQKDLDLLAGKKIHHIELIYTKYAESEHFNQEALNNKRIAELKKVVPQVIADQPNWTWLEQTGAKTRDVANNYFHGFVIHYGDKLDHVEVGDLFSHLAGDPNLFNVNASEGGKFTLKSGTTLHVPANAVCYADGRKVEGDFTLKYSEYRDQSEIALSGLPMMYKGDHFSSVGMYELRGEKDGKELQLCKPVVVDFNCTKVVDDAAFYSMDDRSGEWTKIKELEFANGGSVPQEKTMSISRNCVPITARGPMGPDQTFISWTTVDNETVEAVLDSTAWEYNKGLDPSKFTHMVISKNEEKRSFLIKKGMQIQFQNRVMGKVYSKGSYDDFWGTSQVAEMPKMSKNIQQNVAGHVYPTIVTGLQSSNFGVYNCDQVYRMNPVAVVSPIYTDKESNKPIEDGVVACVIDLSKNGSFSFHPNNLTYSKTGRTAVLLFTQTKEIYLIDERAFSELEIDNRQTITMPMRNVTSMLKSPSDLKEMLNI